MRPYGAIFVGFRSCHVFEVGINAFPQLASRFIVGAAVAIPACSLCINRRLYHIASSRDPLDTAVGRISIPKKILIMTYARHQRYLPVLVDLGIGIGLPVVAMVLRRFLKLLQ